MKAQKYHCLNKTNTMTLVDMPMQIRKISKFLSLDEVQPVKYLLRIGSLLSPRVEACLNLCFYCREETS